VSIIVQKFGGSSVASTEKLFKVCEHIAEEYNKGNQVAVVVSAQGKTTDKLVSEEKEITLEPNKREHDILLSAGEQITSAKLAMCLEKLGYKAISYMGWQVPIVTDNMHGEAMIKSINTRKIADKLNKGNIVIVAGFQGIDEEGDITTLGRGGSDTTAASLAAALKAEKCEIFTDVDGVYTADPNSDPKAKKLETITYDEMLKLANTGAKVLHNRSVEIAKESNVPMVVKSTFDKNKTGTIIN